MRLPNVTGSAQISWRPSGCNGAMAPGDESTMLHRTMSIWTRIAQAVAAVGDSISAFLARVVNTRAEPERSLAFTIGVIALGAKMAKADGVVTGDEVAAFRQVFHVPDNELAGVARVFNLAKQDVAGYDAYARQLARLFAGRQQVLEDLLEVAFLDADPAIANQHLHEAGPGAATLDLNLARRLAASCNGFRGIDREVDEDLA